MALKIEKGIEKDVNEYVEAARAMDDGDSVLMPDAKEAAKLCRALEKEHGAGAFTIRAVDGGVRVWRTSRTPRVRKPKVVEPAGE
jgi:hypothetical protein